MKKRVLAIAVVAGFALSNIGRAQLADGLAIGLNFSGGEGSELPSPDIDTVDAGEITGVIPRNNWNNGQNANGALMGLLNSNGTSTLAGATWISNNTWGRNLTPSPNNDLLSDYLDGGTQVPATVTFTNIPFTIYDVYVYTRRNETADPNDPTPGDSPGRFSDYTVNGVRLDVLTGDVQNTFVLATPTTIGNYVKYEDVTGATLTLQANLDDASSFRSPVDGVQIVEQIPEPLTAGGLAIAGLSLLGLRRFRRS